MELKTYYTMEYSFSKRDYLIKTRKMCKPWENYFLTEEEAQEDFFKAQQIADEKYNQILDELQILREKLGIDFCFNYFYTGDSFGIDEEGLYINFMVNGYEFYYMQD